ncbi:MAG: hypothetical protein Q8R92_17585 [Deltaproteobacteria bacterium]|nr:hypothetical protein [Deltaproteobacteria bacterium]
MVPIAKIILTDADFVLDSDDWSDHVRSITIEYSAEEVEVTGMQELVKKRLPGLKDFTITVELADDFADDDVNDNLFAMIGAASAVSAVIFPTSAGVGASNPSFTGNVRLFSYPFLGAVGELATTSVTFMGDGTLTRAEA